MRNVIIFSVILIISQAMFLSDLTDYVLWENEITRGYCQEYAKESAEDLSHEFYELSLSYTKEEINNVTAMIEELSKRIYKK